jgi:hypothetical protein
MCTHAGRLDDYRSAMTKKHRSNGPRSKEMLLPLPAKVVRTISLENHLALATLRGGNGTRATMVTLLRVLYTTFYLIEEHCSEAELVLFLEAEAALAECTRAAGESGDWQLEAERVPLLEQVLRRSDEVVGGVPKYRFVEAWNRFARFVGSEQESPLPGSRLSDLWHE